MAEFQTVAREGDIPEGEGRAYPVNRRMVAVFRRGGAYYAISDTCPHMGASLSTGYLEADTVYCPWHAWRFSIKDGTWVDNPNARVRTDCYEVRVVDGDVQVRLPDPPPPPDQAGDQAAMPGVET